MVKELFLIKGLKSVTYNFDYTLKSFKKGLKVPQANLSIN